MSVGVSCWLTLAQYTSLLDFGSRTASRNLYLENILHSTKYYICGFFLLFGTSPTIVFQGGISVRETMQSMILLSKVSSSLDLDNSKVSLFKYHVQGKLSQE
jgi:hypothetical protein